MAKRKIQKLQTRFIFADPDLEKPVHDEMIKWLIRNIEDIFMQLFSMSYRPNNIITRWEPRVRMTEEGGAFIGFVDLIAIDKQQDRRVLFEAKTVIESLGALFRQVGMYQDGYIRGHANWNMPFVVVCPDETNAEIIRQQGLYFLKYDPNNNFGMGGV